ncbi:MAG: recombinase family protein [Polyangiales bacterium]
MSTRTLTGLRVAIYARYSSDRQREASIEDQVRRCGAHIERLGGVVDTNLVFADHAISGASLNRPAFEKLMAMVRAKRREVDAVVTEDLSRVSRDLADSARLFKELEYHRVPLLSVADGIDTSARGAKTGFTVKSLLADMYLDDLRDKTLRGLEGRALAGYSTGGLPTGYRSTPVRNPRGDVTGYAIEVDEAASAVVRRVFQDYAGGRSLAAIAAALNGDGVPPPRARTLARREGWVASTIREMLRNRSYIGEWTFKRREWVKVPGTGRRRPRDRDPGEVLHLARPQLRVVEQELWDAVQARLAIVRATYTRASDGQPKGKAAPGRQNDYLFSGLLVCDHCGAPLVIVGGSSTRYYRCGDAHKRRTCPSRASLREPVVRAGLLAAMHRMLATAEGVAYVRERLTERLGTQTQEVRADLAARRERLARTCQRIDRLTDIIADGERSEALLQKLRDLEAQARDERAMVAVLEKQAREPTRLPSVDHVLARVFDLEARLAQDPLRGREELRNYFRGGGVRLQPQPDGSWIARGELLPLATWIQPSNAQRPDLEDVPGPAVYSDGCGGRI